MYIWVGGMIFNSVTTPYATISFPSKSSIERIFYLSDIKHLFTYVFLVLLALFQVSFLLLFNNMPQLDHNNFYTIIFLGFLFPSYLTFLLLAR